MKIDWNYPKPRAGIAGALDTFIGPGATLAELALQLGIPLLALLLAPIYAQSVVTHWGPLQFFFCAILAFDIAGGVITNSTSAAKRWYHRRGQSFSNHLSFVALHVGHLFLVAALYLSFDLLWLLCTSVFLLFSALLILCVPAYLQRPVSQLLYAVAVLLALYVFKSPVGLEWFLPLFYLKLLVSHLVKEEPYRP